MTIGGPATISAEFDPDGSAGKPTGVRERTPWLLGFLCLLIPLLPSFVVLPGPLKSNGSPAKMLSVLLFGLAVLGFFAVRRSAPRRALRPGVLVILLYFLLVLIVYGVGLTHWGTALMAANKTRWLIILLAHTGLAVFAMTRVQTYRQRSIVLGCLAIGLTYACVVGLLQLFSIDLRFSLQPPSFVINTEYLDISDRLGAKRVPGTSVHAIEFSVLAAVNVPLTIHFARYAVRRYVRWLAALSCGVALAAMPAAVSRSGVVALGAALLVYMWSCTVRQVVIGASAGLAAIAGYVAAFPTTANALWQTVVNWQQDESVLTRTADYAKVSETFRANPVFGLGLGAAAPADYGFLDNEWLQAVVQGGIIGVAAMVVLAAGGIFGISAALRGANTRRERDQAYMIGSIFVAILASSFTFDLFTFQQAAFLLFLAFGLLWSYFQVPLPDVPTARPAHHAVE